MTSRKDYVVTTTRCLISRTVTHDDRAALFQAIADGDRGVSRRSIQSVATGSNVTLRAYDGLLVSAYEFGNTLESESEFILVAEIMSQHRNNCGEVNR